MTIALYRHYIKTWESLKMSTIRIFKPSNVLFGKKQWIFRQHFFQTWFPLLVAFHRSGTCSLPILTQANFPEGLDLKSEFNVPSNIKKPECVSFILSFIPLKFFATALYNSVRHVPVCRNSSLYKRVKCVGRVGSI